METSSANGGAAEDCCSLLQSPQLYHVLGDDAVQALKCGICWEFFADPVTLLCGHTFCYSCMVDLATHAESNKRPNFNGDLMIPCPNCRRKTRTESILSRKITTNFPLASLLECLKEKRISTKVDCGTNTETTDEDEEKLIEETDIKQRRIRYKYNSAKYSKQAAEIEAYLGALVGDGSILGDYRVNLDINLIRRLQSLNENMNVPDCAGERQDTDAASVSITEDATTQPETNENKLEKSEVEPKSNDEKENKRSCRSGQKTCATNTGSENAKPKAKQNNNVRMTNCNNVRPDVRMPNSNNQRPGPRPLMANANNMQYPTMGFPQTTQNMFNFGQQPGLLPLAHALAAQYQMNFANAGQLRNQRARGPPLLRQPFYDPAILLQGPCRYQGNTYGGQRH